MKRPLADDEATQQAGMALGRALRRMPAFVTLAGDLGAGKTTLARAAIRALGHAGAVRSPTYTLLESYLLPTGAVHHLDWYRLGDESELELLGFRDLLTPGQSILVEWPERIPAVARRADVSIELAYAATGRVLEAAALTPTGEALLRAWMTEIA